ncbi:GlxA family transcriptional regulator [Roseateles sp. DAIF2]|uniref:GlxA family transcriptional regulator n=1 Tax=Roseateles sp. DAIF2 TaxID=2714952 RepID=UPI001BC8DD49|nr:helix-turn-helix domain-containing protein [Roseateles sp. DAIF2]
MRKTPAKKALRTQEPLLPPPLRVSILALPETSATAVYGLYEMLSSVGVLWQQVTGEAVAARRIEARIVARSRKPYRSAIGTPIAPHASFAEQGLADVIVVTDIALPLDPAAPSRWGTEIGWVREHLEAGAQVCSACTGAILLAEAGLLDGRDATSHWSASALFRDRYPAVRWRPERILCDGGFEGRLLTTGGASSWEDLALHLVARHCGQEEAVRLAKLFVLGDRSDGQLPFAVMARPRQHEDAVVHASQLWLADHYAQPNPVAQLVARSGLPERSFKRRFTNATGYAPVDYVQALRIEEAKQLLESGGEAIERVASSIGYEDPAFFRRLFKRLAGITPGQYRQRYRRRVEPR